MKTKTLLNMLVLSTLLASCGKNFKIGESNNDDSDSDSKKDPIIYSPPVDQPITSNGNIVLTASSTTVNMNQNFDITIQNNNSTNIVISNIGASPYSIAYQSTTCPVYNYYSNYVAAGSSCNITIRVNQNSFYLGTNITKVSIPYTISGQGYGSLNATVDITINGLNGGSTSAFNIENKLGIDQSTILVQNYHSVADCMNTSHNGYPGTPVLVNSTYMACQFRGANYYYQEELFDADPNSPNDNPVHENNLNTSCPTNWFNYRGNDGVSGEKLVNTEVAKVKHHNGVFGADIKSTITILGAGNNTYIPSTNICTEAAFIGCKSDKWVIHHPRVKQVFCY